MKKLKKKVMTDISIFLLGALTGAIIALAIVYFVWKIIKKRNAEIKVKKNIQQKKQNEQLSFEHAFLEAIIPLCLEDMELFSGDADMYIRIDERYPFLKREISLLLPKRDKIQNLLCSIIATRREKESCVASEKYDDCCCLREKEREKLKQLVLEAPFLKPLFEAKSAEWHAL